MAILINGERIPDEAVEAEIERMRGKYQAVFPEQSPQEQESRLREWARENVIEQVLLRQAALSDPREIEQSVIRERLSQGKTEAGPSARTPQEEASEKKEIEIRIRIDRLVEELCRDLVPPSEEEKKDFFSHHSEKFTEPEMVRAAHIVKSFSPGCDARELESTLLGVREEIKSGIDFKELVAQYSDCPENGGDLGFFPRGVLVPEFEKIVFAMEVGQVSEVLQTPFGFHIAKILDRKPERVKSYEEAKETLAASLNDERRTRRLEEFLDARKVSAVIRYITEKKMPGKRKKPAGPVKARRIGKPLQSILVKPAGPDCNLLCGYCFYREKETLYPENPVHRMSEAILENMIQQALSAGEKQLNFGWQGGEPTLMGLPFFEKAVELQKKYRRDQIISNGFQTNGLCIDGKWADFFTRNTFLVGLSLDGPEHIHDRYRLRPGGKGSWKKVVNSAKLMLSRKVDVNALIVLNDYSAQYPAEIYRFHRELGIRFMQFIPCVETDRSEPTKITPYSVSPEDFGSALCTLFDLWRSDFKEGKPQTSIRFFDSLFFRYVGLNPPECTLLQECGIYLVVEHNGDVYACDFFVEPRWRLGNIMDERLPDMLNSSKQTRFGLIKSDLAAECRRCRWLPYCLGGCPKDRVEKPSEPAASYLCPGYQVFFQHAHAHMSSLAEEWKRHHNPPEKSAGSEPSPSAGRNSPCPCGSGLKYKKCCGG